MKLGLPCGWWHVDHYWLLSDCGFQNRSIVAVLHCCSASLTTDIDIVMGIEYGTLRLYRLYCLILFLKWANIHSRILYSASSRKLLRGARCNMRQLYERSKNLSLALTSKEWALNKNIILTCMSICTENKLFVAHLIRTCYFECALVSLTTNCISSHTF